MEVARNFLHIHVHKSGNFLNLLPMNMAENDLQNFLNVVEDVHEDYLDMSRLY